MISSFRSKAGRILIAAATALVLTASIAEARAGRGGGGFGSRGFRTFQTPPATQTAPRQAAPIERSATTQAPSPGVSQAVPGRALTGQGGFLSTRGGLLGGLLGAGLFGMLLGYGFSGGLGGLGSMLGLLLQVGLIVFLASMAFRLFQSRRQPAHAAVGAPLSRDYDGGDLNRGGLHGGSSLAGTRAMGDVQSSLAIEKADFDEFERLLGRVQEAYGREDVEALRGSATPEVVSYLAQELAENASRGVVNRVSDPRLLQGDLAESWREGSTDYATVAMRFSLIDVTVDRDSGSVVDGDPDHSTEATEVWTFMRTNGGRWLVTAIQQG